MVASHDSSERLRYDSKRQTFFVYDAVKNDDVAACAVSGFALKPINRKKFAKKTSETSAKGRSEAESVRRG